MQTARVAAGTGAGVTVIAMFARDAAGPQLRRYAVGTAMPSMGTAP